MNKSDTESDRIQPVEKSNGAPGGRTIMDPDGRSLLSYLSVN